MVDWSGIHSITVSMHEGMLLLATIAVVVRFLVAVVPKIPVVGWFFSEEFLDKTARVSEPVAFIAGFGGTVGILASAVTGTILSSPSRFGDPAVFNKIMISIFAFVFWVDFLVVRLRYGDEKIWSNRVLGFFYPLLGVVGFGLVTLAGSIGGSLAGKGSILDFVFEYLGINKHVQWVVPQITEFSKMVVNSPLQSLANVSSILQIVIIINVIIASLVLIYVGAGTRSKATD